MNISPSGYYKFIASYTSFAVFAFCVGFGTSAYAGGSITAGREKAIMCDACHGLDGHARMPEVPNLAGQGEGYILHQLHSFKSGERKNEQMAIIVQSLTPEAMQDLAAYFSAIEIKIVKVPGE